MQEGTARCEVCGNNYDLAPQIVTVGASRMFDGFECVIHALVPICERCGAWGAGHDVQADGAFFCCAHCAREAGKSGVGGHV